MHPEQYAVVRCNTRAEYRFSTFHDSLEIAKAEALRLAEKEGVRFIVLKVVGIADKKPQPVEWQDF